MDSSSAPQDLEAERQILGALLVRPDLFIQVSSIISGEDLFLPAHQVLFQSLAQLFHEEAGDIDPLRVIHYLRDREKLDAAGGDAFILRIAEDVLTPANTPLHARRVKQLSLRRSLIEAARAIVEDAGKPFEDENQFLKRIEDRVLSITNRGFVQGIYSLAQTKNDFLEYLQKLIESKGMNSGLPTHFNEFDQLTAGLKGGELIILAARPGMGKTTFAMNIASNVSMLGKKNVLVFSLEMSRMELMLRLICSASQFNHGDLKRGNIPQNRVQDILTAVEHVFSSPMHIDDTGALDIFDLILRSRKLALELDQKGESLGLIVVDYLQLVSDPESRKMGRQHEVATISRGLKQMAKTLNVPVVALSQMNRSVEQRRGDSRPQLSDLRESGAIEQDADIVMFIHREQFNEEDSPEALENRGTAEIIIAKHRNGPVGSFRLAFRPEVNRFDNIAARENAYA